MESDTHSTVTMQQGEGYTGGGAYPIVDPQTGSAVYTAPDVARLMDIPLKAAYELFHRADFPAVRQSPRRMRVPVQAFYRWLNETACMGA